MLGSCTVNISFVINSININIKIHHKNNIMTSDLKGLRHSQNPQESMGFDSGCASLGLV